jgi:hypothetical protein
LITQDEILGILGELDHLEGLREHRTTSFPLQPSLRDCSCFAMPTQDFIP